MRMSLYTPSTLKVGLSLSLSNRSLSPRADSMGEYPSCLAEASLRMIARPLKSARRSGVSAPYHSILNTSKKPFVTCRTSILLCIVSRYTAYVLLLPWCGKEFLDRLVASSIGQCSSRSMMR